MKRLENAIYIKVTLLPITNTKPARIKFTQSNTGMSKTINCNPFYCLFEQVDKIFNNIDCIVSYQALLDNKDHYLFVIQFQGTGEIPNFLQFIDC